MSRRFERTRLTGLICAQAAAFEGLRATRDAPPGFQPDDFLPQLRCSTDGGRTVDDDRPPVSAMLQVDVRDSKALCGNQTSRRFTSARWRGG